MTMNKQQREDAAKVLRALAHPIRIGIVQTLETGPLCVSDLMTKLGCSQSMMSQQIRILEEKGIIAARKEGVCKLCELRNPDVLKMLDCVLRHVCSL
jgi:DNA-binding transcriptional ArsR family regulator